MRIRLDVNSVAVKQLESAVWMYAYDFDEVAVHTIAAAALELYTNRLGLSDFMKSLENDIKQNKLNEFRSLWNRPYNFFKHGQHKYQPIEELVYDPESVDIIIYLACEANLKGDERFRLNCALTYKHFFLNKYPQLFDQGYYQEVVQPKMKELGIDKDTMSSKQTLRVWLDLAGHTFINGSKTPFKDSVSRRTT